MILLTDHDIKRIKEEGIRENFYSKIGQAGPYKYKIKQEGGLCVFLSNNKCKIYKSRPLICRFYPFMMLEDDGYIFMVDSTCLGFGKGKMVTKKAFIRLIEEAKEAIMAEEGQNLLCIKGARTHKHIKRESERNGL